MYLLQYANQCNTVGIILISHLKLLLFALLVFNFIGVQLVDFFWVYFQSIKQQHSQTDSSTKCNCEEKFNKKMKDYQDKVEKEHEANTDKALKELSDRVCILVYYRAYRDLKSCFMRADMV